MQCNSEPVERAYDGSDLSSFHIAYNTAENVGYMDVFRRRIISAHVSTCVTKRHKTAQKNFRKISEPDLVRRYSFADRDG